MEQSPLFLLVFKIFLILHIVGGGIGLLTGSINMVRRKGDRYHRIFGFAFTGSMLLAALSALVLSVMHAKDFLFIIGIFTIYLTGSGARYLHLRGLLTGGKALWVDWLLTGLALVFGLLLLVWGLYLISNGVFFGMVFTSFGGISLSMAATDLRNYQGKAADTHFWLTAHLQRMIGAYIAALTAFLVVNIQFSPGFVVWLAPTAVLTPLIVYWSRKNQGEAIPQKGN